MVEVNTRPEEIEMGKDEDEVMQGPPNPVRDLFFIGADGTPMRESQARPEAVEALSPALRGLLGELAAADAVEPATGARAWHVRKLADDWLGGDCDLAAAGDGDAIDRCCEWIGKMCERDHVHRDRSTAIRLQRLTTTGRTAGDRAAAAVVAHVIMLDVAGAAEWLQARRSSMSRATSGSRLARATQPRRIEC